MPSKPKREGPAWNRRVSVFPTTRLQRLSLPCVVLLLSLTLVHPVPGQDTTLATSLGSEAIGQFETEPVDVDFSISQMPAVPWATQFNCPGYGYDRWGTAIGTPDLIDGESWWLVSGAARAYFTNDQRIEFTGLEATFGVEGALRGEYGHRCGDLVAAAYGEVFLTQPFDRNILLDTPHRRSFANNFDTDIVSISLLSLVVEQGPWAVELGRFVTPFGRYYGVSWQNDFADSPFLRSESIQFRETGVQVRWNPGNFRSTLALTNGGPDKDANSSKAVIARIGGDWMRGSIGASIKAQDGIGSEGQKEFNGHVGMDWMFRLTDSLILSGEIVHDEYGIRRPGLDLDSITWGRSLYNRQLNRGLNNPIFGLGYYVALMGQRPKLDWSLSYGEFTPDVIGDPIHDLPVRRFVGHVAWHLHPNVDWMTNVLMENELPATAHQPRALGTSYWSGVQVRF